MVEYVLAVTMMWTAANGQVRSAEMSGVYVSHQACTTAMANRIETMKVLNGVAPLPIGTVLCVPRDVRLVSAAGANMADIAAAAAAKAAGVQVPAKPQAK
jgi:hypothetical protein